MLLFWCSSAVWTCDATLSASKILSTDFSFVFVNLYGHFYKHSLIRWPRKDNKTILITMIFETVFMIFLKLWRVLWKERCVTCIKYAHKIKIWIFRNSLVKYGYFKIYPDLAHNSFPNFFFYAYCISNKADI